nr:unnamed protein product [Digitaria exilis]
MAPRVRSLFYPPFTYFSPPVLPIGASGRAALCRHATPQSLVVLSHTTTTAGQITYCGQQFGPSTSKIGRP